MGGRRWEEEGAGVGVGELGQKLVSHVHLSRHHTL